jgi:hypothetical protein
MTAPARGIAHSIEIDAPDGPAAFELEHRLEPLRPTTICKHDRWLVDLAGVHRVDQVEMEIRGWLRQIGAAETSVCVDGRPGIVAAEARRRHRAPNADFIG